MPRRRSDQGSGYLFEEAPAQRHSDTSNAAARRTEPAMPRQRARVWRAILLSEDGMTDIEVQRLLKMKGSTERPRRVELVQLGMVRDSGRRRERSVVWEAVKGSSLTTSPEQAVRRSDWSEH